MCGSLHFRQCHCVQRIQRRWAISTASSVQTVSASSGCSIRSECRRSAPAAMGRSALDRAAGTYPKYAFGDVTDVSHAAEAYLEWDTPLYRQAQMQLSSALRHAGISERVAERLRWPERS